MSNLNNPVVIKPDENTVMDGINSIINMIELIGQKFFPRNIMCSSYNGFFPVDNIEQMYKIFKRSNFENCRISAYPPLRENAMLTPNLLLLDIDYEDDQVKTNGLVYADHLNKTKVNKLLKHIQIKFGIHNFMVMKTGNGRHILIPFLFDTPFEYIKEMRDILPFLMSKSHRKYNNIMSESFLPFAKKYLSKNQADQGNYPNFASIFLRVPGTVNTKKKYGVPAIVEIEHEWSYDPDSIVSFGDLHSSTMLFYDFMTHMRITAGNQLSRKRKYGYKPKHGSVYWWIEHLHKTAISDCRKRIIWLILAPYAVNVRKMTSENAFIWIKQWTNLCNSKYPFEPGFNVDQKIDYYITLAEGNGHIPLGINNLSDFRLAVEGNILLWDFLKNTMDHHSVLYDVKKGGYQQV